MVEGGTVPSWGGLISQALFFGCQLPSGSFSFLLSTGLGLCLIDGGFHPGPTSHFLGLPIGLLGAPPAMPLLNGPALSTALLHLALQTQSQKVTAGHGPRAPSSLTSRSPSSFRFQHRLYPPTGGSPSVGLWTIRLWPWGPLWAPACRRCSGLRK